MFPGGVERAVFKSESIEEDHELRILGAISLAAQIQDKELAHCLINPQVLAILSLTGRKALTIHEISEALDITLATSYKLVERMTELGLMARTGIARTSARGRAGKYTSSLKKVTFSMADSRMEATITWKNGQVDCFQRDFLATEPQDSEMLEASGPAQVSPERAA
jgi:predicted transcriptional regulator